MTTFLPAAHADSVAAVGQAPTQAAASSSGASPVAPGPIEDTRARGRLICFSCDELGHRYASYSWLGSSLKLHADNGGVKEYDGLPIFDEEPSLEEVHVHGDVGPTLLLRRSCSSFPCEPRGGSASSVLCSGCRPFRGHQTQRRANMFFLGRARVLVGSCPRPGGSRTLLADNGGVQEYEALPVFDKEPSMEEVHVHNYVGPTLLLRRSCLVFVLPEMYSGSPDSLDPQDI
ncbi:thiamin pyrophosphokinase1 [Striga asiatica]|uniref:Thiamin pyrophosphokinase1 n=1 Tax=Striga asiatica TaxID=4170 RepID=A0A5A7PD79_STRAF|nr:thiamin pyrophosphokinase1 [Striga asiatica]